MANAVCSKCDVGWVIHSHDKHCGYCGCKVFDFSVAWEQEPWIYAGDDTNPHDLTILVENTGAYPITFEPIQTTRDDIIRFPQGNGSSFEVNPGQQHPVPIQVNPTNLARYAETITVRAQDAPPNLPSENSLHLEAFPLPDFNLTPNPVRVSHRRGTETEEVELLLAVQQSEFYIRHTRARGRSVLGVRYSKKLHQKIGAFKKVILELDCNQLTDEPNLVKLYFELRGLSRSIKKRIEIQREIVPDPPRLFVPQMNPKVTQEREKTHTLTLQNRGERPLTIQNIAFTDSFRLIRMLNVECPITIEGGGQHNVELQISAVDIEPGDRAINFTINSNCETDPQYQYVLNVEVNALEVYPHYLAIDFGTTNSCCAYLGAEAVPQLIELGSSTNDSKIMPSAIIYHSQPQNGVLYRVGYEAETARTSEIDGPYYISSVKRWLGFNWNRPFPNNMRLQPSDVVADILKHIIERAEKHLDMLSKQSKIEKCVITYPTTFSRKQQEDIKQAFEKIGINDLKLIDEASAASLGAISQRRQQGDYRLLVYDFGGGTIDIVLSHVTDDGRTITIESLAHGGNPKYGGDDVTQAIVDFVLDEFRERIQKENLNLSFSIPYLSPRKVWQSSGDQKKDDATLRNTLPLYNGAEELKRELSDQDEANRYFPLSIAVGDDVRPLENLTHGQINVSISTKELNSLVADELHQTFVEIDTMIRNNDGHLPEIVILAGQSSKMPVVKKMMTAHFQTEYHTNVDIYLSESPKECVAIGAARYGMTDSTLATVWFDIRNFRKTHTSIGIMQFDGIRQVFKEIIPKGRLIPDESVGSMDMPLRTGETNIDVRERFGENGTLSPIDEYALRLPETIPRDALIEARLKMSVEDSGEIKMVALVSGEEYTFTVERTTPEFIDEI